MDGVCEGEILLREAFLLHGFASQSIDTKLTVDGEFPPLGDVLRDRLCLSLLPTMKAKSIRNDDRFGPQLAFYSPRALGANRFDSN